MGANPALFRALVSIFIFLCLTACGGGGSSQSASVPNAGASNLNPASLPSLPQTPGVPSAVTGTIDGSTAVQFTDDVFLACQFLAASTQQQIPIGTNQKISTTISGKQSGSVSVELATDAQGNGWLEDTYMGFADAQGGPVANGTFIEILIGGAPKTIGLSKFSVSQGGHTFQYQGQMEIVSPEPFAAQADLSIKVDGHPELSLANFLIETTYLVSPTPTMSVSGVLNDPALGSIKVATTSPVTVNLYPTNTSGFPDVLPTGATGEVILTDAHGAILHVTPLNTLFVFLGLDPHGNGTVTSGGRLDRTTGELDSLITRGGPVEAVAEIGSGVGVSQPVTLDARYSHADDGLVTYSWTLIAAPAGSAVAISGNAATVSFQPDLPGGYAVALTVRGPSGAAVDYAEVKYSGTAFGSSPATEFKVPSFATSLIGSPVTLDARSSSDTSAGTWFLQSPTGSNATLSVTAGLQTSFTPDVPGIYDVRYCSFPSSGCVSSAGTGVTYEEHTVVEAGLTAPVRFGPETLILSFPPSFLGGMAISGNFAGTGRNGLAFAGQDNTANAMLLREYPASPSVAGGFAAEQTVNLAPRSYGSILAGDLNGDGVPDLVAPNFGWPNPVTEIWFSSSSGYTSTNLPESSTPIISSVNNTQALVFLDSTNVSGTNYATPTVYFGGSGGLQTTPVVSVTTKAFVFWEHCCAGLALNDLNSDGKTDLVVTTTNAYPGNKDELWIFSGTGGGAFAFNASYSLQDFDSYFHDVFIDDFNGDGKADIAVFDGGGMHFFDGDGLGNFTDAGIVPFNCVGDCQLVHFNGSSAPTFISADMTLLLPSASGVPSAVYQYPSSVSGTVTVGDFNGDGISDLYIDTSNGTYLLPGLRADGTLGSLTLATRIARDSRVTRGMPSAPRPVHFFVPFAKVPSGATTQPR